MPDPQAHHDCPDTHAIQRCLERRRVRRLARLADRFSSGEITQAEYDSDVQDLDQPQLN